MYKIVLLSGFSLCISLLGYSQIGIGTTTPHSSAILDIESSSKGFLPPRVSSDNQISAPIAEGLLIYDESDNCLNVYTNGSWTNLCNSSNSGSVTPVTSGGASPALNLDCSGAFTNISTYGVNSYRRLYEFDTDLHFSFHMNSDSTRLYSNYGHYYNSTAPGNNLYDYQKQGLLSGSVPVLALEQQFPGEKWKNFVSVPYLASQVPGILYLLNTNGELKSMVMFEESNTSFEQRGTHTSLIDPLNDDDVIRDPGTNNNDYRFTPFTHLANDNDASIKFSSLYFGKLFSSTTQNKYVIFTYDNVGKKFYSLGTSYSTSGRIHTKLQNDELKRKATVANVKESFELREADVLTDIITGFGTEFVEGDGKDMTFHYYRYLSNQGLYFITDDDFVNILHGNSIYRSKFPTGVKPRSITGHTEPAVLGDDGKMYYVGPIPSPTYFPDNIRTETFGGVNYNVYENTATLYNSNATDVNNLNIKRISNRYSNNFEYFALTEDNKFYLIKLKYNSATPADYGILTDYSTEYPDLNIIEFVGALEDAVVTSSTGSAYVITTGTSNSTDYPLQGLGAPSNTNSYTVFDLNGIPLSTSDKATHKIRLLYNCIGN